MSDIISVNYKTTVYKRMLDNRTKKNTLPVKDGFRKSVAEAAARKGSDVTATTLQKEDSIADTKNDKVSHITAPISKDSIVAEYKRKHPREAQHVDAQVRAGRAFKAKKGEAEVSTKDMTMEEYKSFITGLLYSIPFAATRIYDQEVISISDEGWEQMKKDSDYEAWVLGYTVENRSVRNPFFGLPGASGSFYVEKFGASIEEHHGQSVGPAGPVHNPSIDGKRKKSWWQKRQEKMEEAMEVQVNKALRRKQAQRIMEQKRYLHGRHMSAFAMDAYVNSMTVFSSMVKHSGE